MSKDIRINIKKELKRIYNKGFIESLRQKDTGIGYTLETELGIIENNSKDYDLIYKNELVEVKARRKSSSAMMTLFTKEPSIKILRDKNLIERYGKPDKRQRRGIYNTCKSDVFNSYNLGLKVNLRYKKIDLIDGDNNLIWQWVKDDIKLKFINLLLVYADVKIKNGKEYFHFNEAFYLKGFKESTFLELVKKQAIVIDLRLHLKSNNRVRSHGTAFRMDINNKISRRKGEAGTQNKYFELLLDCYSNCIRVL